MPKLLCFALMLTLGAVISPKAATAQSRCDVSTSNEWLRQPAASQDGAKIDSSLVRPVTRSISAATAMLKERDFVPLTQDGVDKFIKRTGAPPSSDSLVRPYLVRAVFPTPVPKLVVQWSGNDLHVFAGGLGCFPFKKRPVVLFLEREPATVYVTAMTAL